MTRLSPMIDREAASGGRAAFTLLELLVVMAVIIVLATIALLVVPDILAQDRTTDGASLTRQYLMIAKNRAGRDGLPRGLRLIVTPDPNNLLKTNNPSGTAPQLLVTELQYLESPPVLIPANTVPLGYQGSPHVLFVYNTAGGPITSRTCYLMNLPPDVYAQMSSDISQGAFPVISLPVLGTWHRVLALTSPPAAPPSPDPRAGPNNWVATLDTSYTPFPDEQMGAGTNEATFHFGIYGAPRPLIAEPTQQLPNKICIDLASSYPPGIAAPIIVGSPAIYQDYDIVFAPNGLVIPSMSAQGSSAGQIHLWVRDYSRNGGNTGNFQIGGEQQIVSLKTKSGGLGVFPAMWPPYGSGQDAFTLSRLGANGP